MFERSADIPQDGLAISVDETRGIVRLSLAGRLTARDVIHAIEELKGGPHYAPDLPRLWDLRQADLSKLSRDEFGRISRAARASHMSKPGAHVAVLVSRDIDFGMARMFELTEGDNLLASMRVFRDVEAALAWLAEGRPPAP